MLLFALEAYHATTCAGPFLFPTSGGISLGTHPKISRLISFCFPYTFPEVALAQEAPGKKGRKAKVKHVWYSKTSQIVFALCVCTVSTVQDQE